MKLSQTLSTSLAWIQEAFNEKNDEKCCEWHWKDASRKISQLELIINTAKSLEWVKHEALHDISGKNLFMN
jgi:hypothetical protein